MSTCRIIAISLTLLAPAFALTGCNYGDSELAQFRRQPTPQLMSTAETKWQIQNRETVVADTDLRAFHNDAARLFHLEKPSSLQPGPIGY
ncbi:MAG: hypothetical protein AAGB34_04455 [Planctomycetota bacterium]